MANTFTFKWPEIVAKKFKNYKKYLSTVLMAIVDSNYNFNVADSQVFRNSPIEKRIIE